MSVERPDREDVLRGLQVITPRGRNFQMLVTPMYAGQYGKNAREEFTADLLLSFASNNLLFIDIGAHYGYYTLLVGTKYPKCRIVCFEPVPENCEILRRNVDLNRLENVKTHQIALTDKSVTRPFHIAERSTCSGFYEHPLARTTGVVQLDAVTLDSLIEEAPVVPVIVKVDTEGHEPYVLQGMRNLVECSRDIKLILEFNPKCLRNAGYEPAQFLAEVFQLGFDIYAIDDHRRRAYSLDRRALDKWVDYLPGHDEQLTANLLCVKQHDSVSVCFFSHSAQVDDAGRALLALTRHLIGRSAVCSAVLPGEGPLKEELDELGASTLVVDYHWWCDVNPPVDQEVTASLDGSFANVLEILAELSKINPDVVFTNTLLIPWAAAVASLLGKPHVWFIHDMGELSFHLPFETVAKLVQDFSGLVLATPEALKSSHLPTPPSRKLHTLKGPLTDEETAEEVAKLLRTLKGTTNLSLEDLSQFAARAIVAALRRKDTQIARMSSLEASLQKKEARIKKLETQRAALYSSSLWRITAPLRAAYRDLDRFRHRQR